MNILCKPKSLCTSIKSDHFFILLGFFYSLISLFSVSAKGMDFENTTELSALPFALSGASFMEEKKEMTGFFLTLSADEKFTIKNWRFEFSPEIRTLRSDKNLQVSLRNSVQFDERSLLNQWKIHSDEKSEVVANIEKLNLSYQGENSEFLIGRKPVSLGVLSVFPVWNKFSKPFVTNLGPSRTVSQDQISFHNQNENLAFQIIDIEQTAPFANSKLLELTWYASGFEVHTLLADWWKHSVQGLAFSGDVSGTTLKLETLHIQNEGWEIGTGFERAFSATLSGILEYLYLENGAFHKKNEPFVSKSLFRPLVAGSYAFARLVYKYSDLTTEELGILENLIDQSIFVNPKLTYSYSNNADLSVEARIPTGSVTTEFNRENIPAQLLGSFHWVY